MIKDPYLNCLRAKYGCAVTCHKSQGGEWNDIFLFLDKGMYRMAHEELFRWWYTAVTRAKKHLHLCQDWWIGRD
jgi:ATP-dependent exoDNAse (exonuclease V) alpha subunit